MGRCSRERCVVPDRQIPTRASISMKVHSLDCPCRTALVVLAGAALSAHYELGHQPPWKTRVTLTELVCQSTSGCDIGHCHPYSKEGRVCLTTPIVRYARTIGDLGNFEMVTECAIFHSNRYHAGETCEQQHGGHSPRTLVHHLQRPCEVCVRNCDRAGHPETC